MYALSHCGIMRLIGKSTFVKTNMCKSIGVCVCVCVCCLFDGRETHTNKLHCNENKYQNFPKIVLCVQHS